MGNQYKVFSCMLLLPLLMAAAGCSSSGAATLANEMSFPLDGITEVKIAYDEEDISYYQGDSDQLVVKEYMNKNRSSYYAKVTERDGAIHISEGGKPLGSGSFYRYVEVYLPAGYRETLETSTTSGSIDLSVLDVAVGVFHADTTSGRISIGTASADSVRLTTTSGEINCGTLSGAVYLETKGGAITVQSAEATGGVFEAHTTSGTFALGSVAADQVVVKSTSGSVEIGDISGQINYTTTSGDLVIRSATGSGSFEASNSGGMDVAFMQVTGDISMFNKNDDIILTLPAGLDFYFDAYTKNGTVETNFSQYLAMGNGSVSGDVGAAPSVAIRVESNDGDIHVSR